MGYSCSAKASEVCERISAYCVKITGSSNTWIDKYGVKYFFQVGREQADGAITGSVFKLLSETSGIKAGSFKIEANGNIARFPGLSKEVRSVLHYEGMQMFHNKFGTSIID